MWDSEDGSDATPASVDDAIASADAASDAVAADDDVLLLLMMLFTSVSFITGRKLRLMTNGV